MPWTVRDPPPPAQNWTAEEKRRCVAAANAALERGESEENAIYACIAAAGRSERSMDDKMIGFGGAIKALGDGKTEGYLVRWGSREDTDLEGEFFTPKTFLGHGNGDGVVAMVHHGIPVAPNYADYARRTLKNPIKTEVDDIGVIARHLLDMSDEYEKMVYELTEQGKFGYSSGAIPYAVEINEKTGEIKQWPIIEASYTPSPAEHRNRVVALKAYIDGLESTEDEEPGGGSAPVPVVEEKARESEKKGATMSYKKFRVGSGYAVYALDAEGQKTGDVLEVFRDSEGAEAWIADQKKAPWEKAVDRMADKMSEVLVATRPSPTDVGHAVTKEYAQVKKQLTWFEFVKAVIEQDHEALETMGSAYKSVLGPQKDLTERTGAEGGYLVPEPLSTDFYMFDPEEEVIWPGARVWDMTSRTLRFPALDQTGSTSGKSNFLGGFHVQWNETGTNKPEDEVTFRQIKLETNEISAYTEVHEDVLRDSIINLTQFISQLGRKAVMYYSDEDFIDGNGVGRPLGIINAPATLTVARNTANQFNYVDGTAMLELLMPGSYANAVWIMNITVLDQLLEMTDPNGNYVWQPNARDSIRHPLFGLPVIFTEKNPALGTEGDVMLVDRSHYYVGRSGQVYVAVSEHYQFRANKVAIKVVGFLDGQPALSQAIYLKDGTNQVSPFVMLTDAAS